MSILKNSNREVVSFDVNDKTHRKAYDTYAKTKCWGTCPFRFRLERPYLDVVTMIESKMIAYYTGQEFVNEV